MEKSMQGFLKYHFVILLTVLSKPIPSMSGSLLEGSEVTLNCTTDDLGAILTWVDANDQQIGQGSTVKLINITKQTSGIYRCKSQKHGIVAYSQDVKFDVSCKF